MRENRGFIRGTISEQERKNEKMEEKARKSEKMKENA
jgi:hypothetical protein